jgi:hypothetical protein
VREGRWIGFNENSKGSHIYWPNTRSVTVEHNIYTRDDDTLMDHLEGENWSFKTTPLTSTQAPKQDDPIVKETPPNALLPASSVANTDSFKTKQHPPDLIYPPEVLPEGSKCIRKPSSFILGLISGTGHTSSKPADLLIPDGI